MILNLQHKKPEISFGLGITSASIQFGNSIEVFQNTIYNKGNSSLTIAGKNENIYSFKITPLSPGHQNIQCEVEIKTKGKTIKMKSNILTLTVY